MYIYVYIYTIHKTRRNLNSDFSIITMRRVALYFISCKNFA